MSDPKFFCEVAESCRRAFGVDDSECAECLRWMRGNEDD